VVEHAGLSLQQRLVELDVLAQVEEGAGAGRLDPLVDRLGDVVDDVTDVVNRAVVDWLRNSLSWLRTNSGCSSAIQRAVSR
jgi:hypothetical protein